jgi:hypothetical protein
MLVGRVCVKSGGFIPDARALFSTIQASIGGISDSLSYNHYYLQAKRNLRGVCPREDYLALKKQHIGDSQFSSFQRFDPL